jgi:hypothetical protein
METVVIGDQTTTVLIYQITIPLSTWRTKH